MDTAGRAATVAELLEKKALLAERLVDREFAERPELYMRFGPAARERCLEDAHFHLEYLAEAISANDSWLFWDYVVWADSLLTRRHIPTGHLVRHLETLADVAVLLLSAESAAAAAHFIRIALQKLEHPPKQPESFIDKDDPLGGVANDYLHLLLERRESEATRLITYELDNGVPVRDIYLYVFQPAEYETGRLWQHNEISVAQEHYVTKATERIMSQLTPHLLAAPRRSESILCMSVSGNQHDLGIRMVNDFFSMDGWNAYYLGANTPLRDALAMIEEIAPTVFAVSATLLTHLSHVRALVRAVRALPREKQPMILVGGRAFNLNDDLWRTVGADAYAGNADAALVLANQYRSF